MTRQKRQLIYDRFSGRCAYCGNHIELKDMQVDHIVPKRMGGTDDINNLYPACRRCNHYKRAEPLKVFRRMMLTLHERIRQNYICRVAEDYGILEVREWDGRFYFEKLQQKEEIH